MRALTVQQPWAWAIMHGGKTVENRSWPWSYRGPLAIHAGARLSDRGMRDLRIGHALRDRGHIYLEPAPFAMPDMSHLLGAPVHMGAVIGLVDLEDCHPAANCCEPWGEDRYHEHRPGERLALFHFRLANPRPLSRPIKCHGHQGPWTLPEHVEDLVVEQLGAVA